MIKGAIFDIDGTILDSMFVWDKAGEMFLQSLGIKAEPDLSKTMFNMSMLQGAEFLKERYSLKLNVIEIVNGINQTIKDFYYYNVQLKNGVEPLLKVKLKLYIKARAEKKRRFFLHWTGLLGSLPIYPTRVNKWLNTMDITQTNPGE